MLLLEVVQDFFLTLYDFLYPILISYSIQLSDSKLKMEITIAIKNSLEDCKNIRTRRCKL